MHVRVDHAGGDGEGRSPASASSAATTRVAWSAAALDAQYAAHPSYGLVAAPLEMLTSSPPGRARTWRANAPLPYSTPRTFTATLARSSSGSASRRGAMGATSPALFTHRSMRPKASTTAACSARPPRHRSRPPRRSGPWWGARGADGRRRLGAGAQAEVWPGHGAPLGHARAQAAAGPGDHRHPPLESSSTAAPTVRSMSGFEQAVVRVLHSLRPGEVVTYGEVAAEAGFPGRARASATSWRAPTATCPGGGSSPPRAAWCRATRTSTPAACGPRGWRWPTAGSRPAPARRTPERAPRCRTRRGGATRPVRQTRTDAFGLERPRPHRPRPGQLQRHPALDHRRPRRPAWRQGLAEVRARVVAEVPALTTPDRWPPGPPPRHRVPSPRRRRRAVGAAREARRRRRQPGRHLAPAAAWRPSGWAPPTSSSGRSSPRARASSPRSWSASSSSAATRCPPSPSGVVREVVEADLGRPLEEVFRWFDRTPLAAASIAQVHAATLRTGEQVVVKVQRPTVARLVRDDLRVMAWLAPQLVGRIPIAALANPPALVELFAETIAEELDFRLEAENMLDIARTFAELGQRGYVVPRPHPELVTPPGAGDGAARRLPLRRRRRHAGRRRRHRGGGPHRDDRLHRGRHPARHLPRRPARREPVRPARRAHRAARLRHHRPPRRGQAGGLPAPAHGGHGQRHDGPARGPARPRRAAARHRPRRGGPPAEARPAARRSRPSSPATSWSARSSRSSRRCSASAPACRRS